MESFLCPADVDDERFVLSEAGEASLAQGGRRSYHAHWLLFRLATGQLLVVLLVL